MKRNTHEKVIRGKRRRYRVLVPQEFVQVFYVHANSEDEAIELVHAGPEECEANGVKLSWLESEFLESFHTDAWEVDEYGPAE